MVMLGSPDWVIAWICRVDAKTAQYWRDRCLDAAVAWSKESVLSGHVWIDEMRFAPTRASGFVDGVWETYVGRISKDAYMEVAFDSMGHGFCEVYAKLGTPYGSSVERCLEGRVAEGSKLTHDGALCHGPAIKKLSLGDDWVKYAPGDKEHKAKMGPMNNLCSYLRFNFEKHRGVKFAKLAAYGDLFMYQYFHVRKYGLRGDDRLPVLEGLRHGKEPQLQGRIQENVDVVRIVYPLFAPICVLFMFLKPLKNKNRQLFLYPFKDGRVSLNIRNQFYYAHFKA
jgi:hypothetical protein